MESAKVFLIGGAPGVGKTTLGRALEFSNVTSFWLVGGTSVMEERERKNIDFFRNSSNPERMLENFLAKSVWSPKPGAFDRFLEDGHGMV